MSRIMANIFNYTQDSMSVLIFLTISSCGMNSYDLVFVFLKSRCDKVVFSLAVKDALL